MRGRMRKVSQPRPTQELFLVDLWLLAKEHVMETKESEDHGGSMMGLKLKVVGLKSDCWVW